MLSCNECLHYEVCKGTYSSAKGDEDILYDFDGEMYAQSGCEDFKPKADYVEVRHGYNKTSMHPVDEFWCSECGFCCADYTETKYDEDGDYTYSCECQFSYCPRCGAKMDGKRKESEVRE